MTLVRFIRSDGAVSERVATAGMRLLDVAQADGQPLEGTCNGQLACATCHVVIDADDFARLHPAVADEEDMLDLVSDARRFSRLACQVKLPGELTLLRVTIPASADGAKSG